MKPHIQAELDQIRRAVQAHRAGNIDAFLAEQERRKQRGKMLEKYRPYPKQREFHDAGATYRERMLMAPNQSGKTTCAAAETAMHLTGLYPDWFHGKRFDRPVSGLAASETGKLTRDGLQVHLCGAPKYDLGSGMIPRDLLLDTPTGSSLKQAFDFAKVRHKSGGESILYFRSYDQGSDRVQAMTLDFAWADEEPEESYYYELLARTSAVQGPLYTTMTPLKGMTKIVQKLMSGEGQGQVLISMSLEDAEHYSPEARAALIASYPAHIREARAFGRPSKGSGVVYPVTDESIACDPIPIPNFWRQIAGLDIGGAGDEGHPTAAVKLAHDPDSDIIYVTSTYRKKGAPIFEHAACLRDWGANLPWAWPKDAYQHRESDGVKGAETVKDRYASYGLNMLPEHSQFLNGSISVGNTVEEILERMLLGKWKVFRHLHDFFNEFGMYHRKDGVIVAEMDDIMSAMHYAYRMLRYAEPMKQDVTKIKGYVKQEWV